MTLKYLASYFSIYRSDMIVDKKYELKALNMQMVSCRWKDESWFK